MDFKIQLLSYDVIQSDGHVFKHCDRNISTDFDAILQATEQ